MKHRLFLKLRKISIISAALFLMLSIIYSDSMLGKMPVTIGDLAGLALAAFCLAGSCNADESGG